VTISLAPAMRWITPGLLSAMAGCTLIERRARD
jgi:hypothetical protein